MKNIKYFVFLITYYLCISCDIEKFPQDKLIDDQITSDNYDLLLNGCYGQIRGWADVMHRVREYPADNIMIRGTSTDAFYSFINYKPIPDNYRLAAYWNNSFKVIFQTSQLIQSIQERSSVEVNNSLGEAYYLRGLCYFYMCNTWGRPYYQNPEKNLGVPIVNGFDFNTQDVNELPDRATVKEVYEQAIADLERAASLLTLTPSRGKASKEAAWALLSRIYLYMGGTFESPDNKYNDLSIEYGKKVIESGRFELLPYDTYKTYNELNPDAGSQTETIFAIKFVNSNYPGTWDYYYNIGGMYGNIKGMGWGEMYASKKYLDLLKRSSKLSKKSGGVEDARSVYIVPQYSVNDNNEKTPAFRFVIPTYSKGEQSGLAYKQLPLTEDKGVLSVTETIYKSDGTTELKKMTYTLKHIEDNDYKIENYEIWVSGSLVSTADYEGEKDFMMLLNRTYPMFYVYKCSLQEGYSQLHSPIISRLAEMYLNIAEAYIKKNQTDLALPFLNTIRKRATGSEYTLGDLNANPKKIITEERQLEFAFEAHRTLDVFRNGETMERYFPGPHEPLINYPATSAKIVQLIPQSEINAYPRELTQNPIE